MSAHVSATWLNPRRLKLVERVGMESTSTLLRIRAWRLVELPHCTTAVSRFLPPRRSSRQFLRHVIGNELPRPCREFERPAIGIREVNRIDELVDRLVVVGEQRGVVRLVPVAVRNVMV